MKRFRPTVLLAKLIAACNANMLTRLAHYESFPDKPYDLIKMSRTLLTATKAFLLGFPLAINRIGNHESY